MNPVRPASAVVFEFGQGEASVRAAVGDGGRLRLTLGSGEEYAGPYDEMPVAVVRGARRLLEAASAWSASTPAGDHDLGDGATVRIAVATAEGMRDVHLPLAVLRDPAAATSPLWAAFTSWLDALLVVLFSDVPAREESPALGRARAICRMRHPN